MKIIDARSWCIQLNYRHNALCNLQTDGATELSLSPLELLDRTAALMPPPRVHRHPLPRCARPQFAVARPSHRPDPGDGDGQAGARIRFGRDRRP